MSTWWAKVVHCVQNTLAVFTSRVALAVSYSYIRKASTDGPAECCAQYLCDLALQDHRLLAWTPSVIAASSIELARHCVGAQPIHWDDVKIWEPDKACIEALIASSSMKLPPTSETPEYALLVLVQLYSSVHRFEVSKLPLTMPPLPWPEGKDGRLRLTSR